MEAQCLPIHGPHKELFGASFVRANLQPSECNRPHLHLIHLNGKVQYPFRYPRGNKVEVVSSDSDESSSTEKCGSPQNAEINMPNMQPSSEDNTSSCPTKPYSPEKLPTNEDASDDGTADGHFFLPTTERDHCFMADLLTGPQSALSRQMLFLANPELCDIQISDGQVSLIMSSPSVSSIAISDGKKLAARIALLPKKQTFSYETFVHHLVMKWELPGLIPSVDHKPKPETCKGSAFFQGPPQSVQQAEDIDPCALQEAQEQVEELLNLKRIFYEFPRVKSSNCLIKAIMIHKFPYPFALLPCEPDGSCGYHACVRHMWPNKDCESPEYSAHVNKLRYAVKRFNLMHWNEIIEEQMLSDYPFLKGKPGSNVKSNYENNFDLLEISNTDLVSLSLILRVRFLLIICPLDGESSCQEIFHVSLPSKELHTVFLLQTGAVLSAKQYRSHYDCIFPISNIDGKDVTKMSIKEMEESFEKSEFWANRFLKFQYSGNIELLTFPAIPPKNVC